ncbi:MAG: hypothetical protein RIR97_1891 [Pseudomonadota bacterium]
MGTTETHAAFPYLKIFAVGIIQTEIRDVVKTLSQGIRPCTGTIPDGWTTNVLWCDGQA